MVMVDGGGGLVLRAGVASVMAVHHYRSISHACYTVVADIIACVQLSPGFVQLQDTPAGGLGEIKYQTVQDTQEITTEKYSRTERQNEVLEFYEVASIDSCRQSAALQVK